MAITIEEVLQLSINLLARAEKAEGQVKQKDIQIKELEKLLEEAEHEPKKTD